MILFLQRWVYLGVEFHILVQLPHWSAVDDLMPVDLDISDTCVSHSRPRLSISNCLLIYPCFSYMSNLIDLCILRIQSGLFKCSRVSISNIPLNTAVQHGNLDLLYILVLFEFCYLRYRIQETRIVYLSPGSLIEWHEKLATASTTLCDGMSERTEKWNE